MIPSLQRLWNAFLSFWLRTPPWQGLLEAWLLALLMLFSASQVADGMTPGSLTNVLFFTNSLTGFWLAFRVRLNREKGFLRNTLGEFLLGAGQSLLALAGVLLPFSALGEMEIFNRNWGGITGAVSLLAWSGLAFYITRTAIWMLDFWNRLRKHSLMWSLTHAQLIVVVVAALTLGLIALPIQLSSNLPDIYSDMPPVTQFLSRLLTGVLPVFGLVMLMTIFILAILLPPAAVFSFFFARRTTRRLRRVVNAARRFRSGEYDTRVPVEGEDEVAQLQADFNGMAETLEQTLAALKAEQERVESLLHTRRELFASVSHELRTPVATLRSYLDASLDNWENATPENLHEDLDTMRHETIRLQGLIDDLFTLARAEVDNLQLSIQPVDLAPLIRERVAAIAPLAWQTGRVEVLADVPTGLPHVLADPTRLEQVLVNLLRNAIRFTPPGGIVAVIAGQEDERLRIDVRDTGPGIAPEDLPHIFERFYRGSAKKVTNDGVGLGLALVKELTEAMDGTVEVESTPGQGSCFTVRLKQNA